MLNFKFLFIICIIFNLFSQELLLILKNSFLVNYVSYLIIEKCVYGMIMITGLYLVIASFFMFYLILINK